MTLDLDLHIAGVSSPTLIQLLFSFRSFTLKSRVSCDRLALLNGVGWEGGTKAKLLGHFALFFVRASSLLKSYPKDTAKFDQA